MARPEAEIMEVKQKAMAYNESLDGTADGAIDPFGEIQDFASVAPIELEEGVPFAYLSMPKLGEELPIYLGASNYHLDLGSAHVDGTNLPIGGLNTRSVIAAHRGTVTQTMFLNIYDLVEGDSIFIHVLGEDLEYRVYSKEVIHPSEYGKLAVVPGKDTITLLSCTFEWPNPDRILVNAERVKEPEEVIVVGETEYTEVETVTEIVGGNDSKKLTQTPETKILVKRYGLMGLTGALWFTLFFFIARFLRTYRKS